MREDYKYPFWKEESYFAGEFSITKSCHILIHSNVVLPFSFLCPGSPINLSETFWNFILGKQLLLALLGIISNCSVGLLAAFQLYKNNKTQPFLPFSMFGGTYWTFILLQVFACTLISGTLIPSILYLDNSSYSSSRAQLSLVYPEKLLILQVWSKHVAVCIGYAVL